METKINLKPQVFIFIGRSGCGKGTQAKFLEEYLKKLDSTKDTLYVTTGGEIREFIQGQNYTQKLDKILYDTGSLQPEFLAVYMWSNVLAHKYKENDHIIFDGTPRKYHEAGVLDSILDFYKFDKPCVVHIEISYKEAMKRLLARGRTDDHENEIHKRLGWYETEVMPVLDYYRDSKRYRFITVDGERPAEEIYNDLIEKIGLEK